MAKRAHSSLLRAAFSSPLRTARRLYRRAAQRWHYPKLDWSKVPVLFANSFPKSGTHLLTQVLQGFPRIGPAVDSGFPAVVTFAGESGRRRTTPEILADLRRLKPGDICYGHLHAIPEVVKALCREGVAAYFILRDPRDVVVSHVYYLTEMAPGHIHQVYYTQELHSFDERLRASILGRPGWGDLFPDVNARFVPYLGWMKSPQVLVLRYEDFLEDRESFLSRMLTHAEGRGFPMYTTRDDAIQILAQNINPSRSPTFRSGKAGSWRECFSAEHKQLFKSVAGDLLVKLGYEKDLDW